MQNEVNRAIETTGYKIPCRQPELTKLFFSRGKGSSTYTAAKLACTDCKLRPECLADELNNVAKQVAYGDPVSNRPRNHGQALKSDFSPMVAGLAVNERIAMANWFIDAQISPVTVEMARVLLAGGIEAAEKAS